MLDDIESARQAYVLPDIKRNLAALGIHGLAEHLRWEAYVLLAGRLGHENGGEANLRKHGMFPVAQKHLHALEV